jgi:predicted DsbA family dithiol-disulfide isomerase
MAGFAGLDQAAFATCLSAGTAAGEVSADTTHGTSLGVSSTPTLRFVGPAATLTLRGVPQWEQIVLTMNRVTGRAPLPEPSSAPSPTPAVPVPGASEAATPARSPAAAATPAP